uniref:PDZ domain-containing protein n=1 Tax=Oryza punctata TaxID=4537 RepID=A0A0E0M1M1_ORYPU
MPKKKRSAEDAALYVERLLFGDDPSDSEADVDEDDTSDLKGATNKDDSSDEEDFTEEGLSAKEVALSISKSIVSLISSVDGKVLFTCSGSVVDHVGSATWILTSATLVRKCDNDYDAYQEGDVKIEVLLHNKTITEGCLAMCSLQYNIAVVTIEPQFDLPLVKLHDLPVCYSMLCRPVIAVARNFKSKTLLVRCGEMTRERSELDCDELLVCTCPVSKVFIGGLVMDFERRILGITFYDKDTVPFLPIEIAVRCLEHFKNFRTLKQPSLCIRGQAIHKLAICNLEKICYTYPELSSGSGIVVEKVRESHLIIDPQANLVKPDQCHLISEVLPENCGSIEAGDIICSVDDIVLYSVSQLTSIFLDKMAVAMPMQDKVTVQAEIRRPRDKTEFVAKLNIGIASGEHSNCFNNRFSFKTL